MIVGPIIAWSDTPDKQQARVAQDLRISALPPVPAPGKAAIYQVYTHDRSEDVQNQVNRTRVKQFYDSGRYAVLKQKLDVDDWGIMRSAEIIYKASETRKEP